MSFGGDADEAESARMYAACRDAGVNHFDCANVYNGGRSEEILGRLVGGHRDQVFLATKAYFPTGEGPNDRGCSRYHLVRAAEASLRRLATDRIDLFYLHRFDEQTSLEESLRAVDDLTRSGKVLYLGLSNFAAWQVAKALGIAELKGFAGAVAIQPMYTLAKRTAEIELLPMAASEGVAVFPYSPLGGGLLTGKYTRDESPTRGRLVDVAMYRTRYGAPANYELAERFSQHAAELAVDPVSLAIAWVAAHPAVTAPLLGARSVAQLDPALRALEVKMSDELYEELSGLSEAPPPATDRNEETTEHHFGAR